MSRVIKPKVCLKRCNQCLFTKNRIVSEERMKEILNSCKKKDTFFICHKSNKKTGNVACRGFYGEAPNTYLQLAQRLNFVEFIKL